MKRKLLLVVPLVLLMAIVFGLPAFAQTKLATLIPGQPLSRIAASEIISNSGLPIEVLKGGVTNSLTRGRDAVNAYRYAHGMLSVNGWYRGMSDDHTPLLRAMVSALEGENYRSSHVGFKARKTEVLQKFWFASDTRNAKELGFTNLTTYRAEVNRLLAEKKQVEADQLIEGFDAKWQ